MTSVARSSLALVGLLSLAVSAGCAGRERGPTRPETPDGRASASFADRHEILLELGARRLEVPVANGDPIIDSQLGRDLAAFARDYLQLGQGPITIAPPESGDSVAVEARLAAVTGALRDLGVGPGLIARGPRLEGLDALTLSFAETVAIAPECAPLWEQNLAFAPDNRPWASFGCAGRANLAEMIADPRDLDRPSAETPLDAHRRQVVLDRYRQGEVTHANRSDSERVAISVAAQ